MAKKHKSRAELEAELKELRRAKLTSSITEIILNLIRFSSLVLCVYFITSSIAELAGKSTAADIIVNFLGNFNIGQGVALLFGTGGTLYGLAERRQRQKMIERQHGRIKKLEEKIDPKRSSSNITESGDTNPSDY